MEQVAADLDVRFIEIPCRLKVTLVDGVPVGFLGLLMADNGAMVSVDCGTCANMQKFFNATRAEHVKEER